MTRRNPPRIPGPAEVLEEAGRTLRAAGRLVLCHIVRVEGSTPGKPGWRLLVRADGSSWGNLGGGAFEALIAADAAAKLGTPLGGSELKRYYLTEQAVRGEATGMVCGGFAEVFLEVLQAAPLLAICGGGPVGQALAWAAQPAGFDLLAADDRPAFRRPDLFPAGTEIAEVDRDYSESFLEPFRDRELFVAVVTRCWESDTAALASVLRQAPPRLSYLGLMGSRRKIQRVRREVEARGFDLSGGVGARLHAPIGLPIGGDTPGEIAVGVVAELIRERYRAGSSRAGVEEAAPAAGNATAETDPAVVSR